jgi:hypothetical protein
MFILLNEVFKLQSPEGLILKNIMAFVKPTISMKRKLQIPYYFNFNVKTKLDSVVKKLFVVNPFFSMV